MKEIIVKDIFDKNNNISTKYTSEIYEELARALKDNVEVKLNFDKINILYTAFFNDTIGKLILECDNPLEVLKLIKIVNLNSDDAEFLKYSLQKALEKKNKI